MNTPNNKRRKTSQDKIEKVFIELIQTHNINAINITDIVKKAQVNRSTFYANYIDIYDLAEKIKEKMFYNVLELYKDEAIKKEHSYDYLKLFKHIKENQIYYNTLFKLNFDFSEYYDDHLENEAAMKYYASTKHIDYHIEFFKAGIMAMIKKWLACGCQESPEEIAEILKNEYKGKSLEK